MYTALQSISPLPRPPTSLTLQAPPNYEEENPEEWQREEQEKIDSAEPLSEEELKEKEELLQAVSVYIHIIHVQCTVHRGWSTVHACCVALKLCTCIKAKRFLKLAVIVNQSVHHQCYW